MKSLYVYIIQVYNRLRIMNSCLHIHFILFIDVEVSTAATKQQSLELVGAYLRSSCDQMEVDIINIYSS